ATCDNVFKSGSRLFAVARDADHTTTELWAISDSGGTLIWKNAFRHKLVNIFDYDTSEMIAIADSGGRYNYYVVSKQTGAILFQKTLWNTQIQTGFETNYPYVLVDNDKNILVSYSDTCRKYR